MNSIHLIPSSEHAPDLALRERLAARQQVLKTVAQELKAELFGIDEVIDQAVDAVRAWYVMPEIIVRPVIVCLWGLTGTGKTQLVRRLAQKLGFYDRFLEVQMDGFSHGSSRSNRHSISGMLADSGIQEGNPGILLLDEFQRYRTVDTKGNDVKVERYQDVWALLSDGRLPPPLSFLGQMEHRLATAHYDRESADDDRTEKTQDKARTFLLDAWEASDLKEAIKLREPLLEIMRWTPEQIHQRIESFKGSQQTWETDFSKLLIFVTGNLDEMYKDMASRIEDCDTDADVFRDLTRKLSVIDVKKSLGQRLRPEQVARLGNHHLIYPSLGRDAYQRLIQATCTRYVEEVHQTSGVRFDLTQEVLDEIYANAVFPAQGTRPVFSTIHAILGTHLVDAALWVIEQGLTQTPVATIAVDRADAHLVIHHQGHARRLPAKFELSGLRQRPSVDFRTLLAVHEAGHGLIYALLLGRPPLEVRINVASFEGGYNSFVPHKAYSRRMWRDLICVDLAGRAAEMLVFGRDATTSGAEQDYKQATADAARYVRFFGFGSRISRTDVADSTEDNLNTDMRPTNGEIEALLQHELQRASDLLALHRPVFRQLVNHLIQHGTAPAEVFIRLLDLPTHASNDAGPVEPWQSAWQTFEAESLAVSD